MRLHRCGAAALFLIGCAFQDGLGEDEPSELIKQTKLESSSPSNFPLWPTGTPIQLCFVRGETNTADPDYLQTADFNKLKGWVLSILASSWGSVAGVSFQDGGSCSSQKMTIKLFHNADKWGNGGVCGYGVGAVCEFGGNPVPTVPEDAFTRIVIHEVGHGLGMLHEHQRSDSGPLCAGPQNQLTACTNCKTGFESTGTCSASDWNNCVFPNPLVTAPVSGSVGSSNYNTMMNPFLNNCRVGTAGCSITERRATGYDPVSVMNYCVVENGGTSLAITDLDKLGLAILYPAAPTQHALACRNGCFNLGTRDAVVITGGSLVSDWTALGALGISPTWSSGGWSGTMEVVSASNLQSGSVTFAYTDFANRAHSGFGTLTKSDSLFSALTQTTTFAAVL